MNNRIKGAVSPGVIVTSIACGLLTQTHPVWAQNGTAPASAVSSADTAWLMIASALVLLMTPALALFYGGLVRRKNVLNVMMMSLIAIPVVTILWVLVEYSLIFTTGSPVIGDLRFALLNNTQAGTTLSIDGVTLTVPVRLHVVYQLMFAIITPALISGAVVERMKFGAYVAFIALWSLFVYTPVAHMVWGDQGLLYKSGALDFAGGLVVHLVSGVSALVLSLMLGARKLRPGEPALNPHNLPMTLTGAFLLWFGWFGFNAGSALASNDLAVNAFLTTHVAAAVAALTWATVEWVTIKKPTAVGFASGAVIGLVAITPGSGYVGVLSAIVIGAVAALAGYFATRIKGMVRADDTLDVFAIHGVGGLWGSLAVGLFADPAVNKAGIGLLFGGGSLMGAQLFAVLVTVAVAATGTALIASVLKFTIGLRVTDATESAGLDQTVHGEDGYDDDRGAA